MARLIFFILISILVVFNVHCQPQDSLKKTFSNYQNNVFAEGGGALWYGVGYERVLHSFKKHPFEIYSNLSFSYYPNVWQLFTNPGMGFTYGRKHQVDFEVRGLVAWNLGVPIGSWQSELKAKQEDKNYILPAETISSIGIGYRLVLFRGRFLIRAKPLYQFKYDLAFQRVTFSRFWFNVGFAYKFGK